MIHSRGVQEDQEDEEPSTTPDKRSFGYVLMNNMRRKSQYRLNGISVSYNKHFEVPRLLSPVFTGRDEDLQCLTTSLAPGPSSPRKHQRRYVLFGLGGSGKTQICLKYVQEQRERYVQDLDETRLRF